MLSFGLSESIASMCTRARMYVCICICLMAQKEKDRDGNRQIIYQICGILYAGWHLMLSTCGQMVCVREFFDTLIAALPKHCQHIIHGVR